MDLEEHYRKLERMYDRAPINRIFLPSITVEKGRAFISMEADEWMHHGARGVHGSVYFKMLDDAAFFAVSSVVTDVFVLTTEFNIKLRRPFTTGLLRSEGELVLSWGRSYSARAALYDERARLIADGGGNFVPSRMALSAEMGYV